MAKEKELKIDKEKLKKLLQTKEDKKKKKEILEEKKREEKPRTLENSFGEEFEEEGVQIDDARLMRSFWQRRKPVELSISQETSPVIFPMGTQTQRSQETNGEDDPFKYAPGSVKADGIKYTAGSLSARQTFSRIDERAGRVREEFIPDQRSMFSQSETSKFSQGDNRLYDIPSLENKQDFEKQNRKKPFEKEDRKYEFNLSGA